MGDRTWLDSVLAAERRSTQLLTESPEVVVAGLVDVARRRSCYLVTGASPSGHQLVGAMVLAEEGRLTPWTPDASGAVLVVDSAVVSTHGLCSVMALITSMTDALVSGVAFGAHPDILAGDSVELLRLPPGSRAPRSLDHEARPLPVDVSTGQRRVGASA